MFRRQTGIDLHAKYDIRAVRSRLVNFDGDRILARIEIETVCRNREGFTSGFVHVAIGFREKVNCTIGRADAQHFVAIDIGDETVINIGRYFDLFDRGDIFGKGESLTKVVGDLTYCQLSALGGTIWLSRWGMGRKTKRNVRIGLGVCVALWVVEPNLNKFKRLNSLIA